MGGRHLVAAILAASALLIMVAAAFAADRAPGMIGIRVGQNVSEVKNLVLEDTAVPVWSQEYLSRVDIAPVPGFKSGYVSYGNCAHPGRILRMKLNYEDGGKDFFEKIVAALKERYGARPEFRGDAFGTLKVWKWSLEAPKGTKVSLIVENYAGDDDNYSQGNSVRLSVPAWINEEAACWRKMGAAPQPAPDAVQRAKQHGFNWFLPLQ